MNKNISLRGNKVVQNDNQINASVLHSAVTKTERSSSKEAFHLFLGKTNQEFQTQICQYSFSILWFIISGTPCLLLCN